MCAVAEPSSEREVGAELAALPSAIARGNGRSYGDSSLNPDGVISTRRLANMLAFDKVAGILVCEAGVMLSDVLDVALPHGWFAPVTPGTRFVTIGGMIASDVHGKNHHGAGSFADHLLCLDLALPDGSVVRCSREAEPDLFAATCGGMGLTGVIMRASFRLMPVETAYIRSRTIHAADLDEAFEIFEAAQSATYSVGVIDALARGEHLGRCVIFIGEHARRYELPAAGRAHPFARKHRRPKRLPIDFPPIAMSRLPVQTFNIAYSLAHPSGESVGDLYPYFYPLDAVLEWNRIYGRRGFAQYQCVLPLEESPAGMRRLLEEISRRGGASFLTVLKRMGPGSFGHLSFPMEGYTLAIDFPAHPETLALLDRLDAITAEHGGRIYLTKDSRAKPSAMAAYPRLEAFREVRRRYGLCGRVESLQSRRLQI
jgi:decaprenylphospho-beta-D-ribofuranose 2-oxidase